MPTFPFPRDKKEARRLILELLCDYGAYSTPFYPGFEITEDEADELLCISIKQQHGEADSDAMDEYLEQIGKPEWKTRYIVTPSTMLPAKERRENRRMEFGEEDGDE